MVRLNDPVCMMYLHVLPSTVGNVLPYIYIYYIYYHYNVSSQTYYYAII